MVQYKKELLHRGYSRRKIEQYAKGLGIFFIWCHGSLDLFTEERFREFLSVIKNKGKSLYKIRQYRQTFRFFSLYVLKK